MTNVSICRLRCAAHHLSDDGDNWCAVARLCDALIAGAVPDGPVRSALGRRAVRGRRSSLTVDPQWAVIGPITDKDPVRVA